MSTTYSIQDDNYLRYYVSFAHNNNAGDNIRRDGDENFYYISDTADIFLLMPAQQETGTNWYYVFRTNSHYCWTIGSDNSDLLEDHSFTGDDNQKFCFEDAGNGNVYIVNKGSGKSLYKSSNKYESLPRFPDTTVRQGNDRNSHHVFTVKPNTAMPVYMPSTLGNQLTDDQKSCLYLTSLLGIPPSPLGLNQQPAFPPKVLIGETLLPFFNVKDDPSKIGTDLVEWQISNHPYYRYRREQQQQYHSSSYINQAQASVVETKTISYTYGLSTNDSASLETSTSFQLGFTSNHEASCGFGDVISATSSHGFNAQWERDVTLTVSYSVTQSASYTVTDTITVDSTQGDVAFITWQACDIWTLYYDNYKTRENDDHNSMDPDPWVFPSQVTTSTSYPSDASVKVVDSKTTPSS